MSTEYAEQRTIIKFCVNLGKTSTQTREMLETVKIKLSVSIALIFKWHKQSTSEMVGNNIEDDGPWAKAR